ncbi:zinc ribbon domain-containing protein [Ruminococcus flavefaciens]|uniref:zinc ribbon domain-containing protein n=1 Tax=Ruminococcus flavefaciens TaxID=1265 RepID=UPI0026ED8C11|nr:zinc ribbon domain-containing protein [Ruminococcus flavefaciens]
MKTIKTLEIDIETYSDIDLLSAGVYPYAESSQFDLLLFGYSVDGSEVQVIDVVNGECIPDNILKALTDDSVIKYAHNASFERICMSVYLRRHYPEYFRSYSITEDTIGGYLDPASWRCTMVWSAYDGLPLSLRNVGAALHLDSQKMDEGKALIRLFCVPDKNGERHYPSEAPDKWELFREYNKRDVEVEMAIQQKLSRFPVPETVWDEYHLSEEINDRGILIDMPLVEQAVRIDAIIDRETFVGAQALMVKSTAKVSKKNENPFRGKVKCRCGRSYFFIPAAHRNYWECSARFDIAMPCDNPIIYDDALNAAWERLCTKLRRHADDILTPCLGQLAILEENINQGEILELENREKELRQRRYVLCKLCAENCITHEKLLQSEAEIEVEFAEIADKIDKISAVVDDTAEHLEIIYKLISTTSPQRLIGMIIEKITIDNGTAVFELKGGLKLREVM